MVLLKEAYQNLVKNPEDIFVVYPEGEIHYGYTVKNIDILDIVPGSFNPLHSAHRYIYNLCPKANRFFELSLNRTDKESLSLLELESRLTQFQEYAPVLATASARMQEKIGVLAENHRNELRIYVGFDVLQRIIADHGKLMVQGMNCKFVAYRRSDIKIGNLPSNVEVRDMPERFNNVSSTQIRKIQER